MVNAYIPSHTLTHSLRSYKFLYPCHSLFGYFFPKLTGKLLLGQSSLPHIPSSVHKLQPLFSDYGTYGFTEFTRVVPSIFRYFFPHTNPRFSDRLDFFVAMLIHPRCERQPHFKHFLKQSDIGLNIPIPSVPRSSPHTLWLERDRQHSQGPPSLPFPFPTTPTTLLCAAHRGETADFPTPERPL